MRRDHLVQQLAVLLAVTHRPREALALVADFPAHHTNAGPSESDRRFLRQLARWVEAGSPTPPPAADTVARLPLPHRPRTPTFAEAGTQTRLRQEALAAVREAAPTSSRDQLRVLLVRQLQQRGLEVVPSTVETQLDAVELLREPLGQVRGAWKVLTGFASVATAIGAAITSTDDTPPQLRRPTTATYPLARLSHGWVLVDLFDDAEDFLSRAITDAPRTIAGLISVDVWFTLPTDDHPAHLTVHIGPTAVGTTTVHDADACTRVAFAAELYDETPYTSARLGRYAGQLLLEVTVPF